MVSIDRKTLKPVLLVEDTANDIELALFALQTSRLANPVHVVRDGEEALDYLVCRGQHADRPQINPAVILLDLQMPKIGGIEVLSIIRLTPRFRHVPVIVITTSREDEDYFKTTNLKVDAYIVKPIDAIGFAVALTQLGLTLSSLPSESFSELHSELHSDLQFHIVDAAGETSS